MKREKDRPAGEIHLARDANYLYFVRLVSFKGEGNFRPANKINGLLLRFVSGREAFRINRGKIP